MEKFSKNLTRTTKLSWDAHIDIFEEYGWGNDGFNVYFDSKIRNFKTLQEAEDYALTLVVKKETVEVEEIDGEKILFLNWVKIEDSDEASHYAKLCGAENQYGEIKIWVFTL